eukprot:CAMPEP_0177547022 /NCGR_PEP_ID=MMETSP0369-20130122/63570_1 /TAXON_ID=447022 ORGANISM="Scrippsiella hangoei-like, Strain SHHI-4" /NCGR_SAMPLE_ID=MMETSP0369 /ASSEMBLY_ACC=CAM_ASM_000364 /LENGTH=66 /DNA_ID=CAMNT_0019031635 /DNA_START=182 /DNA_END=379 /DNA_ORIENTATION=-
MPSPAILLHRSPQGFRRVPHEVQILHPCSLGEPLAVRTMNTSSHNGNAAPFTACVLLVGDCKAREG